MTSRREFSKRQKAEIALRATNPAGRVTCEGCGLLLGAKPYEIDHIIAEALILDKTRPLTISEGQLLGRDCCHRGGQNKTATDVADIARAKRRAAKHAGIRKPSAFKSKWRRKVSGETVLRES